MIQKKILILLCLIFSASCVVKSDKENVSNSLNMPHWIYNPSSKEVIGGVGVCGSHVKGKTGQRELASLRALEDIARQKGVEVSNILVTSSNKSSYGNSSSNISSYSIHTISGAVINAIIVDTWIHPETKELYIYMQEK